MHNQDPRTKTALAPSTVRTGDGAAASCCPARERAKLRRPCNPDDRLIAATLKPSMPLESFIVRSAATLVAVTSYKPVLPFFRPVMNSRTASIDENTLSLLRELQG